MRILVIGGGASGVISALLLKRKNPSLEVIILEQNNRLLKKLKATGNGRCNINNLSDDPNAYNHPDFVKTYLKKYDINNQIKVLNDLGIYTKPMQNDGLYPLSESANNVVNILLGQIEKLGINVLLDSKVVDYKKNKNGYVVSLENGKEIDGEVLLFAVSLKSSPQINGDTSFIDVLGKHNYEIIDVKPGLCPIKVKENVASLFGTRVKAEVSIKGHDFKENGEVLFKRDGLSGIAIMNASSYLARNNIKNATIALKLNNIISKEEFVRLSKEIKNPLLTMVSSELARYISNLAKGDINRIYNLLTDLEFSFNGLYPFKESQVSVGGISIEEIDQNLMSKREENVFFLGEVLDIDGKCGGFNLKWCLLSSLIVSDYINSHN